MTIFIHVTSRIHCDSRLGVSRNGSTLVYALRVISRRLFFCGCRAPGGFAVAEKAEQVSKNANDDTLLHEVAAKIARDFKESRTERNLTIQALAARAKVSPGTVVLIEGA